jgi:hypothetical protein
MNLYRNNLTIGSIPQLDVVVPEFFPKTGLVSYYKLDGNSNDAHGSNNGTDTSITYSLVNGKIDQGGGFVTATPSYVSLPAGVRQSGSFTFSAWIKPNTLTPTNAEAYLICEWGASNRNYIIQQYNSTLNFLTGNGGSLQNTTISGGTLTVDTWQHVACIRDGTTCKIYLNGSEVATNNGSYSGGATTLNVKLGADNNNNAGYGFGGAIDEVGIWSRALTSDEITKLYNNGNGLTY